MEGSFTTLEDSVQIDEVIKYYLPVMKSVWILYPIQMYDFLLENPRHDMINSAFNTLYITGGFSFHEPDSNVPKSYIKLKHQMESIDIENMEKKMLDLIGSHATEIHEAIENKFTFNIEELIEADMLLWYTALTCSISGRLEEFVPINFQDRIIDLAKAAKQFDDIETLGVIYNYFNLKYDNIPVYQEFYEKLDKDFLSSINNSIIERTIPFSFNELIILVEKINEFLDTEEYETKGSEELAMQYSITSTLLRSIWSLYPLSMYDFLRENPREKMIPIAFNELFNEGDIIFPEIEGIRLPKLYLELQKYMEDQDYYSFDDEIYDMIDLIEDELAESLMFGNKINEDELIKNDNLFWYSSILCAFSFDLENIYEINMSEKFLELARLAKKFDDIQTQELIYNFMLSNNRNLYEFNDFYDAIEENISNLDIIMGNPAKINHSFIIIICGIDKIVQVTHHASLKDTDSSGEIIGKLEIYWFEAADLFSIPSDQWQKRVKKYNEAEFKRIANKSIIKIFQFIEKQIKEFDIQQPIFITHRKILTDFEKWGISNSSGMSKKWRRKYGKTLSKSISTYLKRTYGSKLIRVDMNEEEYLERNKSDKENYT